ncbi:MAG: hypothetical protein ACFFF4_03930 [Candidatus Thorarchaeota archaeon]
MTENTNSSMEGADTCLLCVDQEVAKLISLCLELNLELKSREDVRNLIRISGYSYLYNDPVFIERVIDAFLDLI